MAKLNQDPITDQHWFLEDQWSLSKIELQRLKVTYFAVFDGHGEKGAADYLKERLYVTVGHLLAKAEQQMQTAIDDLNKINILDSLEREVFYRQWCRQQKKLDLPAVLANVISQACADAHSTICTRMPLSGSMGTIALLAGNHLVVGTVGNSEAVFGYKKEGEPVATRLTPPADLRREFFWRKIVQRGGSLYTIPGELSPRIYGYGPSIPSSLGDALYPLISGPLISHMEFSGSESPMLIIGSDGLWTKVDSRTAVSAAMWEGEITPAARLVQLALSRGTMDNTTVIVVRFKNN